MVEKRRDTIDENTTPDPDNQDQFALGTINVGMASAALINKGLVRAGHVGESDGLSDLGYHRDAQGVLVDSDGNPVDSSAAFVAISALSRMLNLKPYDPDFSLDTYNKDPKFKPNRDMDREDELRFRTENNRPFSVDERPQPPRFSLGRILSADVGEKQKEFYGNLKNVAAVTGAPVRLLGAMWAIESRFSKNELSPTGCQGPMQFTRGTFAVMIREYGDRIPGMEGYAAGLRNGTIKPGDASLQALRNNQTVAGYAAGFYAQDIARSLKVDINDPSKWGQIYAAYNVGPGSVRKLLANQDSAASAKAQLGRVAEVNPQFYRNDATPAQALANYQTAMANASNSFDKVIVARLDPTGPQPIMVAQNTIKSNVDLGAGFASPVTQGQKPAAAAAPSAPRPAVAPVLALYS